MTIPVGDTPLDIIWNPASNKVYVANSQSDDVTIIDGATNQVIGTVAVPEYPAWLSWNSRENEVFSSSGEADRLSVICGVGDTLVKTLRIQGYPGRMAFNVLMNKLYVQCNDEPIYDVVVIDAGPDTVLKRIRVPGVGDLLYHPVTNRVFVCGDSTKVIDCLTDEIVARLPCRGTVWCYNPMNQLVYLGSGEAVYVLTPEGDSVVAVVPGYAWSLSSAPFPNKVFAAGGGVIRVIDGVSNRILDSLVVGGGWMSLVTDLTKGRVYCSNVNANKVDIIDARADTVIKSIPLGRYPERVCWNQTNSRVYITDGMDDVVYVIRDTSSGVAERKEVAGHRSQPGVTLLGSTLYWAGAEPGILVDAAGRAVAVLRPGENDLGRLASGVYVLVARSGRLEGRVVKLK